MQDNFKVGDKVVVVDGLGRLANGAVHTITWVENKPALHKGLLKVEKFPTTPFFKNRFKLVAQEEEKPKRVITDAKVGEKVICIDDSMGNYVSGRYAYSPTLVAYQEYTIFDIRKIGPSRTDFQIEGRDGRRWYTSRRFAFPGDAKKFAGDNPHGYRLDSQGRVYHPYYGRWLAVENGTRVGQDIWDGKLCGWRRINFQIYKAETGKPIRWDRNVYMPTGARYTPLDSEDKPLHYYRDRGWWGEPGLVWSEIAKCYGPKDHIFLRGKWWHKDDPKMPPPIPTLNDLGLKYGSHYLGCGVQTIYNWYFVINDNNPKSLFYFDNVVEGIKTALKGSHGSGIVLAVINPTEEKAGMGKVIEACGFKLLSKHINYNHNHPNWLYGYVVEEQKKQEKARKFG